jgi:hypothetical protein
MLRGNTGSSLGQLQQCGGEKQGLTLDNHNNVGCDCPKLQYGLPRHIVVTVLS